MTTKTNVKLNEELNGHLPVKLEEEIRLPLPNAPLPEEVLEELRRTHPLGHLFGKYKDEPLKEEWLAAIAEYRQERDEWLAAIEEEQERQAKENGD